MMNKGYMSFPFRQLAIVLMCCMAMQMSGQSGLRPRGDVNCDWDVNIADVNVLVDAVTRGAKYHGFYTYSLDMNGDKEINIADVNMMIDGILGAKLAPMPCYSGTLPVLFINTDGHRAIVSKEEYLQAQWWIDPMGHEEFQSIGSAQEPQGMLIKGRGNATWTNVDKKSFRLKFDKKHKVLGMPSSRHWTLMAYPDSWMGKINDAMAFEIGLRLGMAWNPRQEPVEVVMNGQYIGLYFLTEKIRVAKDRVNIIEQKNNETDLLNVTGGWLLEIDNYKEPGCITVTEDNGQSIWFTPHSPDTLSGVQRAYITRFLEAANAAIYCENKNDRPWEEYIDIDSLAVFYIVHEAIDNPEAFSGSCFLHKERGDSTKLVFGPIWDCGSSFNRYSQDYAFDDFIYENMPSYCRARWIKEISRFPHFQERVRYHWQQFYHDVYPAMDEFMDQFAQRVEAAGNADYQRWPEYSGSNITSRIDAFYRPSFHKKVAWLQSQWSE